MPGMRSPSHCCVHSTRHSRTASDHRLGGSGARSLHEAEAAQHGADSCRLPRLRKEPLSLPARPSVRPSVHSSVHPELASCLSKALTKTPAPGWPCAVTLHSGDVYLVLERGVDRRGGQRAGRGGTVIVCQLHACIWGSGDPTQDDQAPPCHCLAPYRIWNQSLS